MMNSRQRAKQAHIEYLKRITERKKKARQFRLPNGQYISRFMEIKSRKTVFRHEITAASFIEDAQGMLELEIRYKPIVIFKKQKGNHALHRIR